jgi:MoxR-like ATPase
MTSDQARWFAGAFAKLVANVEQAVIGKPHIVRLALTCLLSEGHLLLEDYPGTGKTSLAKTIANSVQGTHSRIQFTPDLLPSDVTGVAIFDQRSGNFNFHDGPKATSRWTGPPMTSAGRSWSSPPRTPSSRPAPTGCPRRSSTGS